MDDKVKALEDEYIIKDITRTWLSDQCFTPYSPPRLTQTTYGKYLIPVGTRNDYCRQPIFVHPKILDKWANNANGFWVDTPGKNDYFVHDMLKYNLLVDDYSPKHMFTKQFFPRPYTCEYDYVKELQLCGMKDIEAQNKSEYCKKLQEPSLEKQIITKPDHKVETKRWKPVPNVLMKGKTICQRREELFKVGQPFHHEACRFYYDHYKQPELKTIPVKFGK